jgi:hypothetical protein
VNPKNSFQKLLPSDYNFLPLPLLYPPRIECPADLVPEATLKDWTNWEEARAKEGHAPLGKLKKRITVPRVTMMPKSNRFNMIK